MQRLARAALFLLVLLCALPGMARERQIEQLTTAVPSDTAGAPVDSFVVAHAANRVVFRSNARDLLPIADRRHTLASLFRFDGDTGRVSAIPVRAANEGEATAAAIDPNGRWLLVASNRRLDREAGGSVATEPGAFATALFLIDMDTGDTELVTRRHDRSDEAAAGHITGDDRGAAISVDGRYVHYSSTARLLDPAAPESFGIPQLYRFDRQTGANRRIGFLDDPTHVGYETRAAWVQPDGARVLFTSEFLGIGLLDHAAGTTTRLAGLARELISVSDNGAHLLFCAGFGTADGRFRHAQWSTTAVADGGTTTINPPPPGLEPNIRCFLNGHVSNDGLVVSVTDQTQVTDGVNSFSDYQVVQWTLPALSRVLVTHRAGADSLPASGVSYLADADSTGNRLVILSNANDLVPGQTGLKTAANFLWERDVDRFTLISARPDSPTVARASGSGRLAGHGASVYFRSASELLAIRDTNRVEDLFAFSLARGTNTLVSRRQSELRRAPNRGSFRPTVSRNGQRIAYQSAADDLLPGMPAQADTDAQVYVQAPGSGTPILVSARRGAPALPATGASRLVGMDGTGRFVAFESFARDLDVPPEFSTSGTAMDTFVRDMARNTTILVTRDAAGSPWSGVGNGDAIAISDDAAWVLYRASIPARLVSGFEPGGASNQTALLWLATDPGQPARLATHAHDQPSRGPNEYAEELAWDPGLRWVAFQSRASNLVPASPQFSTEQVFASSRIDGRTLWLTASAVNPGTPAGGGLGSWPQVSFSDDGAFLIMTHSAGDLAPPFESAHGTPDCFRVSMATGLVSRVVPEGNPGLNRTCQSVSADGRFVVYGETGPGLDTQQLWRVDLQTGTRVLVSVSETGEAADSTAYDARISADGNQVLFVSAATNLGATPSTLQAGNLFLRDVDSATTTLVTDGPAPGADGASAYLLSFDATPDFDRIVFAEESGALRPDIVDAAPVADIFLSSATRFAGNPGLSGLWGEPGREGQGFHLVSLPATDANGRGSMLLSWYTYQPVGATGTRTRQRWLLGLGTVENGVGTFAVSSAEDGRFDEAAAGVQVPRGSVTIRFADCNRAEAQYAVTIDGQTRAGLIPLERITPDTACSGYRDRGPAALAEVPRIAGSSWQYGLGGAWHDPAKPGQGLLIEVMPQSNQVIATWFTFDAGQTLGNDRQPPLWLAAIGPVNGNRASLSAYESSGGTLDQAGGTTLTTSGTIELDVASCNRLMATFAITMGNTTRSGQIPLERITPDAGCVP